MKEYKFDDYDLILSNDPCDIFHHYNVKEMHGLSLKECESYNSTVDDAYIAGLCNTDPHQSSRHFVFINTSRCTDDIKTMGLVMHELFHLSLELFEFDVRNQEEEIITFAESESYKIVKCISH